MPIWISSMPICDRLIGCPYEINCSQNGANLIPHQPQLKLYANTQNASISGLTVQNLEAIYFLSAIFSIIVIFHLVNRT